jgi:hypothetical protein
LKDILHTTLELFNLQIYKILSLGKILKSVVKYKILTKLLVINLFVGGAVVLLAEQPPDKTETISTWTVSPYTKHTTLHM